MKPKSILLILTILVVLDCRAQEYVGVMDQSFTVHSAGNIFVNTNSSSRNVIEVTLPVGTRGYIYRVTASKRDAGSDDKLSEQLKGIAPRRVITEATLAQFAIEQIDATAVDVFAFNNTNDVNYFMRKLDNNWRSCWYNTGVINTCFATAKCLGPTVYLGFRNNNLATPVNVHLEVVAIVDTAAQGATASGYTIVNGLNQGINYLISTDQLNWQRYSIMAGDAQTLNLNQPKLYIRVVTSLFNMVTYNIQPGRRYRIIINAAGKLDVIANP